MVQVLGGGASVGWPAGRVVAALTGSGLYLQGSRWTIQAARMNMAFVSLICKTPMTSLELVIAGRILGFKLLFCQRCKTETSFCCPASRPRPDFIPVDKLVYDADDLAWIRLMFERLLSCVTGRFLQYQA